MSWTILISTGSSINQEQTTRRLFLKRLIMHRNHNPIDCLVSFCVCAWLSRNHPHFRDLLNTEIYCGGGKLKSFFGLTTYLDVTAAGPQLSTTTIPSTKIHNQCISNNHDQNHRQNKGAPSRCKLLFTRILSSEDGCSM